MTKLIRITKNLFIDWETSFRTLILAFIPLITAFSVMSDRNPYNYINIALYAVEIPLIIFYVWKWKKFRFDILTFCIVLFNITIFISQIFNKRISEYPTTILLLSIFAITFYQFAYNEKNKDLIYKLIVIGGLLFAAYFIFSYRYSLLALNFADRLGDDFSDQNDLSKYLTIFALLSMADIFKQKRFQKILPLTSTLIFIFLMLITGSVSNLLCFIIVGFPTLIFCSKRKNRFYVLLGTLILALIVYGLIQLPFMEYFKKRIDGIFNAFFEPGEKVDGSASDRIKLFTEGFNLFLTRPFFGYGYDQVQYYTHGKGMFSHSNIAELLASFGIVGFLSFEVLLVYPLYYSFNNDKYKKNAVITLGYLFAFQFFLIIFRKKIEFMLIPLGFSYLIDGDNKAIEVFFDGLKPTVEKVPKINQVSKTIVLLLNFDCSKDQIFTLSNLNRMCGADYELKTCVITSNDKGNHKYDMSLIHQQSKYRLRRELSDIIDEVNPRYIITNLEFASFVASSSLGKSLKIISLLTVDDLENKALRNHKIYGVIEGEKGLEITSNNVKTHKIYCEKINTKKDFNNLINLLK